MADHVMKMEHSRAQLEVFGLSVLMVFPAALKTIIQLNVADTLAATDSPLSAQEILNSVPGKTEAASAKNLERLLRILAFKGVFKEELTEHGVRKFSLTPMSRALVKKHPEGSMANYVLLASFGQQFTDSLKHLDAAVLNSEIPFAIAHDGKHQFEYCASNPAYSNQFQAAMSDHSNQLMKLMLAKYDGFKSVQRMADVGGGMGTTIARIVEFYPHIHGINFDLPHVVAIAPPHQGVEHISGDMFKSVPSGCDAFLLKNIIHDWDDDRNIKVLVNCYNALPSSGKVIMIDALLPTDALAKESLDDLCAFEADITMMAVSTCGRERDETEWRNLATKSGFTDVKFVKLDYMYVVEATKP